MQGDNQEESLFLDFHNLKVFSQVRRGLQYFIRKTKKLSLIYPYFAKKKTNFHLQYILIFLRVANILINVHFVQGCLDP